MSQTGEDHAKQLAAIREEMRFEIGIFHERVNALISAEAFLLISFTMALAYAGGGPGGNFFWITAILPAVGFTLAALAWPGIRSGYRIIVEWNILFVETLNAANAAATVHWRPSVFFAGDRRTQADHRHSMLFSHYVPVIFMIAWVLLAVIVLSSPWR